jgi:biotin transporter BioY
MEWLKKAPTAVVVTMIIVCGVIAALLVGAFVLLTLNGADTTEFRQWVNTLGQILVFPLLGVTAVASTAAARSASKAEDQTNGQLDRRDEEIAHLRSKLNPED